MKIKPFLQSFLASAVFLVSLFLIVSNATAKFFMAVVVFLVLVVMAFTFYDHFDKEGGGCKPRKKKKRDHKPQKRQKCRL